MNLLSSAAHFAALYNARRDLVEEQTGWGPTIVLCAADTGAAVTVRVADGTIVEVREGDGPGDVVITADQTMLCDVLELRRGPNEPYLWGELTVRGPEADFIRLDYITERLCPR
jgi:hypothetical protein